MLNLQKEERRSEVRKTVKRRVKELQEEAQSLSSLSYKASFQSPENSCSSRTVQKASVTFILPPESSHHVGLIETKGLRCGHNNATDRKTRLETAQRSQWVHHETHSDNTTEKISCLCASESEYRISTDTKQKTVQSSAEDCARCEMPAQLCSQESETTEESRRTSQEYSSLGRIVRQRKCKKSQCSQEQNYCSQQKLFNISPVSNEPVKSSYGAHRVPQQADRLSPKCNRILFQSGTNNVTKEKNLRDPTCTIPCKGSSQCTEESQLTGMYNNAFIGETGFPESQLEIQSPIHNVLDSTNMQKVPFPDKEYSQGTELDCKLPPMFRERSLKSKEYYESVSSTSDSESIISDTVPAMTSASVMVWQDVNFPSGTTNGRKNQPNLETLPSILEQPHEKHHGRSKCKVKLAQKEPCNARSEIPSEVEPPIVKSVESEAVFNNPKSSSKNGRKRRPNKQSDASLLDFSFLEEEGSDMYSQVKSRRRKTRSLSPRPSMYLAHSDFSQVSQLSQTVNAPQLKTKRLKSKKYIPELPSVTQGLSQSLPCCQSQSEGKPDQSISQPSTWPPLPSKAASEIVTFTLPPDWLKRAVKETDAVSNDEADTKAKPREPGVSHSETLPKSYVSSSSEPFNLINSNESGKLKQGIEKESSLKGRGNCLGRGRTRSRAAGQCRGDAQGEKQGDTAELFRTEQALAATVASGAVLTKSLILLYSLQV